MISLPVVVIFVFRWEEERDSLFLKASNATFSSRQSISEGFFSFGRRMVRFQWNVNAARHWNVWEAKIRLSQVVKEPLPHDAVFIPTGRCRATLSLSHTHAISLVILYQHYVILCQHSTLRSSTPFVQFWPDFTFLHRNVVDCLVCVFL